MSQRAYDDLVTIRRDRIEGTRPYAADIRDMHFGGGSVCHRVSRAGWSDSTTERGLVYCDSGHCILVPTVCRNVSRIDPAAVPQQDVVAAGPADDPLEFDPPGAGLPPDGSRGPLGLFPALPPQQDPAPGDSVPLAAAAPATPSWIATPATAPLLFLAPGALLAPLPAIAALAPIASTATIGPSVPTLPPALGATPVRGPVLPVLVSAVPEPSTPILLLAGAAVTGAAARKKRAGSGAARIPGRTA